MQDRVPVNPGRVLITPENGGAAYYATMTRADNPTQEGTPLNKTTLLKDATAALYGLGVDATPDDVLVKLGALYDLRSYIATGSYVGTGALGSSNPNMLTFEFEPKILVFFDGSGSIMSGYNMTSSGITTDFPLIGDCTAVSTSYNDKTSPGLFALGSVGKYYTQFKFSADRKTLYWYNDFTTNETNGRLWQLNAYGTVYRYIAIG